MKKRNATIKKKICGFIVDDVERGFFGDMDGGGILLENMGLNPNEVPFSIINYLETGKTEWPDKDGNLAKVSFRLTDEKIICTGKYLGEEQTIQLFREWESYEDKNMICKLESEALGELTMRVIFEKFIGSYEF